MKRLLSTTLALSFSLLFCQSAIAMRLQLPVPAGEPARYLLLDDTEILTQETFSELLNSQENHNRIELIEVRSEAQPGNPFYRCYEADNFAQYIAHAHNPTIDPERRPITSLIAYHLTKNNRLYTVQRLQSAHIEGWNHLTINPAVVSAITTIFPAPIHAEPAHAEHPSAAPENVLHPAPVHAIDVVPAGHPVPDWWHAQNRIINDDERDYTTLSRFFASTRNTPLATIAWSPGNCASKLHLGFYDPRNYQYDNRLLLIDYAPHMLPQAFKDLLHHDFGFDIARDQEHIEFDSSVWQMNTINDNDHTFIDNEPHNIILHGLIHRWSERHLEHSNVTFTAGITALNGITTAGQNTAAMPTTLSPHNFDIAYHNAISPNNGRWLMFPGNNVGSFWLVAIYDPARDAQLSEQQRRHVHRKALVSFVTIIRPTNQTHAALGALAGSLENAHNIHEAFNALAAYNHNIQGHTIVDDATLTATLAIMQDPEHAHVAIPTTFIAPEEPATTAALGFGHPTTSHTTPFRSASQPSPIAQLHRQERTIQNHIDVITRQIKKLTKPAQRHHNKSKRTRMNVAALARARAALTLLQLQLNIIQTKIRALALTHRIATQKHAIQTLQTQIRATRGPRAAALKKQLTKQKVLLARNQKTFRTLATQVQKLQTKLTLLTLKRSIDAQRRTVSTLIVHIVQAKKAINTAHANKKKLERTRSPKAPAHVRNQATTKFRQAQRVKAVKENQLKVARTKLNKLISARKKLLKLRHKQY